MDVRETMLSLALEHEGDWDAIYGAIKNKNAPKKQIKANDIKEKFITVIDDDYPECLKEGIKPPVVLFYEGDFDVLKEAKETVALLNDNTASEYSIKAVMRIAEELTERCAFIVPFGQKNNNEIIRKLLSKGSSIIAVLNTGIGEENSSDKELYRELREHQLIVGAFPPNVSKKPKYGDLSCSNLQASLSKKILVGAISKKSPFLVAIGLAAGVNKQVYCIPHQSGSNYANNSLIKEGACLAENGEDIE